MVKGYDNIDDVKSKLGGTIVYHKNQPVVVKEALLNDADPNEFDLYCTKSLTSGYKYNVKLSDPDLNYTRFNIGYANYDSGAFWWFRNPLRQYHQGLKAGQMKYRVSERTTDYGHVGFGASKQIENMLTNVYPDIAEIEQLLKDSERPSVAFHRDLALSWDKIFKEMVVEHKGKLIGCMSGSFKNIKIMDEYDYLKETIEEAVGAR